MNIIFLTLKILALVWLILFLSKQSFTQKLQDYFPIPFWLYFLSMTLSQLEFFPKASPVYSFIGLYLLVAAIFLMLIGVSLQELRSMGPKASLAMLLATGSMLVAGIIGFALFMTFLPSDAWKSTGALLGTWIGGSINMIAIKEFFALSEESFAPLVIVDTIVSYTWMAFLLIGVGFQKWFDRGLADDISTSTMPVNLALNKSTQAKNILIVLLVGGIFSAIFAWVGKTLAGIFTSLSVTGWAIFISSTTALLLSSTKLKQLKNFDSQKMGQFLLYIVLVSIGAKAGLDSLKGVPLFIAFGAVIMLIHGVILLVVGRWLKLPLYLLAIASQANVGGAVSAPILAAAYRPNASHLGVLMAVLGTVIGTYLGILGGFVCKIIYVWVS